MKCIIYGLYNSHHMPIIEKISQTFPIEYCHIIGNDESNKIKVPFIKECVFDNWHEITEGYKNFDWNLITPLDAELVEKMRSCEIEVLRMMDRKSTHVHGSWTYEKRKRVYLEHLRYWNHILNTQSFDFFWGLNIPHEVIDYVISSLCKQKNIPSFYFYQWSPDLTFLINDWKNPFPFLEKTLPISQGKKLSKYLEKDFVMRTSDKDQPLPFYFRKELTENFLKSLSSYFYQQAKSIFSSIKSPKHTTWKLIHNYHVRAVNQFYENLEYTPRENEKYIYFPLHLQPELSTSPMAGPFVDQVLIVQMLSYYLPKDVSIYIKEHPFQNRGQRPKEFYPELASISGVKFINANKNSSDLVKNSLAIATATGTTGWEALFLNKSVLLFGNTFYQYCPGVFKIKSRDDCRKAIKSIEARENVPTREALWQFLYHLGPHGIEGNIDVFYSQASEISYDQDISNLAIAFLNSVKSLYKKKLDA